MIALVLDFLDFIRLVPDDGLVGEHLLQLLRADPKLSRKRAEQVVKVFVSGDDAESKRHVMVSFGGPAIL
jgi:hypothetical protein